MGNLRSVQKGFEKVGFKAIVTSNPKEVLRCSKVVLPGVGAFKDCMKNLENKGFIEMLNHEIIEKKKPILGICLGMQVMAKNSTEGGFYDGLGWFDAEVIKIETKLNELKIPQIGWNNLKFDTDSFLFKNIPTSSSFYFVHSYYMHCFNPSDIMATCVYGTEITAAVQRENIVATQFHPEKSQEIGLRVLENFISWKL